MAAARAQGWAEGFDESAEQVASCFSPHDLRARAIGYLRGPLGPVQRKSSWQLAEQVGDASPHTVQRLLDRARWDPDAVWAQTHESGEKRD